MQSQIWQEPSEYSTGVLSKKKQVEIFFFVGRTEVAIFLPFFSILCTQGGKGSSEEKKVQQILTSKYVMGILTEVAGEGGTDCPPQKFLSSQKFRHLMG